MIILICGFVLPSGVAANSLLGRIIANSESWQIKIQCVNRGQRASSSSILVDYNEDSELIRGFLSWLSFRRRTGLSVIESFKCDIKEGFERDASVVLLEIIKETKISSECSFLKSGCSWNDSASRTPSDHLLRFSQLLRQRGNDRYGERQYGSAFDLYNSALLALAEWETLIISESHRISWEAASLDTVSNLLQASIDNGNPQDVLELLPRALALALPGNGLDPDKQRKCRRRIFRIHREQDTMMFARVLTLRRELSGTQAMAEVGNGRFHPASDLVISKLTRRAITKREIKEYDDQSCTICLQDYREGEVAVHLNCHHYFHENCITRWLKTNDPCPLCQQSVE